MWLLERITISEKFVTYVRKMAAIIHFNCENHQDVTCVAKKDGVVSGLAQSPGISSANSQYRFWGSGKTQHIKVMRDMPAYVFTFTQGRVRDDLSNNRDNFGIA